MLKDKSFVITGSSNGIGASLSREIVRRNGKVIGISRNEEKLMALKSELGDAFSFFICDVQNEKSIDETFEQIISKNGKIDGLINNAGLGIFNQFESVSLEEWNTQLQTNLTGTFLCTKSIVPQLKKQQSGIIVNIASIAGKMGIAEAAAYNASKFGVVGFSESIMHELRNYGIRVTCICPGSVDTNFFDNVQKKMETSKMMRASDIANMVCYVLEQPEHLIIDTIIMRPLGKA